MHPQANPLGANPHIASSGMLSASRPCLVCVGHGLRVAPVQQAGVWRGYSAWDGGEGCCLGISNQTVEPINHSTMQNDR